MALFFLFFYTAYCFIAQPDLCDLQQRNPQTTAFMELRKNQWMKENEDRKIDQRWISLKSISMNLKNAVVTAEDPNFYTHQGLDFYNIKIAFEENWEEKKIVRGASTITQQLMKNLYLNPSQTPLRKWKEAILAIRVERCVEKDRILEIYLNVIEWGESTYGIEAAARKYFGKPASSLNLAEAALLAAMIPNPGIQSPHKKNPNLVRKKNGILKLMLQSGKISKSDYYRAVNQYVHLR